MPFDNEKGEAIITKKKTGVKLTNEKSTIGIAPQTSAQIKEEFMEKAKEVNHQLNVYGERAGILALQFRKLLDDKTLPINKTPFAIDAERELLSNLVQLAVDMNTDEHEQEGMGSVGLITLLMRSSLIQRDKINVLEYALSKLDQKVTALEATTAKPLDSKQPSE